MESQSRMAISSLAGTHYIHMDTLGIINDLSISPLCFTAYTMAKALSEPYYVQRQSQ